MTPEEGRWILLFGAVACATQLAKAIALYFILWHNHRRGGKGLMQFFGFQFLLVILIMLPYQDPKASKAMNRFLLVATVLQYISWVALAYIILIRH